MPFNSRPEPWKRIHFGCNGSIERINSVPPDFIRVGDTASASDPGDSQHYLWKCTGRGPFGSFEWERMEPWTSERSSEYIRESDTFCLVPVGDD